jgi:predicted HAD superfamily Cof-like phosphohydrolase
MDNKLALEDCLKAVAEFHDAFGVKNNFEPTTDISDDQKQLRHDLMKEENKEYFEAAENNDLVEVADALGDQLYILCGTILKHGLQDRIGEIFQEIHRSNMSKLGADGKPIYREDGKVLKGPDYFKPNIAKYL